MMAEPQPAAAPPPLNRLRYLRLITFFGRLFLNVLWWEIVLRALLGHHLVSRGRAERLRRYAARFRRLAVAMGGVLIKLGQFVSARVDVMPPEIVDELAGLQDEVQPASLPDMLRVLEDELHAPPDQLFESFDTEVQAAASLGQVYRARLCRPDCANGGDPVIVKIQRPGIERIVATDLAALRVVAGWAMLWPLVRRRADVPALLNEFAATLWEELDYVAEAGNAERFAELFASDAGVYIPAVYREVSSRRVLTLEDVTSIKITDADAIDAAGIDRKAAARRLLDIYLRMIFDFGFFHADPHPGNLFLYPLPDQAFAEMTGRQPANGDQPFYLIFVDFGMVGRVKPEVRDGLREALIAVGTRDSQRVLKAYQKLGILLPSADLRRIEEAEAEVLDYIWGKSITDLARMPHTDMRDFVLKYRDLIYEMPFQVPQDFIYLGRAVGILAGICTLLDPDFNPWQPLTQYAQRFVAQEARRSSGDMVRGVAQVGQRALTLPSRIEDVLGRAQRGDLSVKLRPDGQLHTDLRRLESAAGGLKWALVFAALLLSGTLLTINGLMLPGLAAYALAGAAGLVMLLGRRPA